MLVADVGIDARSAGSEAVYTYRATGDTRVGDAHFVPLGPRRVMGFVMAVRETDERELGFDVKALKDLGPRVEGVDLPASTVALAHEVAHQTLSPLATAVSLVAPPGIRDRVVTQWRATGKEPKEELTSSQKEALSVLREGGINDTKSRPVARGARSALNALERRGLAARTLLVAPTTDRNKPNALFRLTQDSMKIEKFLSGAGKKRPAQMVTVMRLQGSETASFTMKEIKALSEVSDSTVRALVTQGLLEPVEEEQIERTVPPVPNPAQQKAIDALTKAIEERKGERFLLYGVTGSGKTEVYLRAAADVLEKGRQVLYLVPEIALTAQVVAQLRGRFGKGVAVMHSNMTPVERLENWMSVRQGESPVVLGARSALFAPFTDLGLVIVDEEHEASYKQENAPRYQTKRLASFLAERFGAPLVMGSATPSVETFYEAEQGRVTRLDLPDRTASAKLPEVHIEDLTTLYREKRASLFSPRLEALLKEALAEGHQAILFLNRRSYSPFIVCRDCGHRFLCPNCSVALALHRRDRKLRCHHCGHQEPAPDTCPECGGNKVSGFGVGAEKVEEAVRDEFPTAKVARLDRDTTRIRGALEETFAKFRAGDIDVLVGTQMVAKGLDFPNVTVVGVIAADVSLNIPDFRAAERTFQLLSQVAGRAGRGSDPGQVVVQTFNPTHVAIECARTHDYESMFATMVEERKEAAYPPFVRLVNVLVIGDDYKGVVAVAATAAERIRNAMPRDTVLGPTSCPIERRKRLWRRHILVKMAVDEDPSPVLEAVAGLDTRRTRVFIDVDPYSFA
ncbi:MAG TPA: primosomal protein N' [Fimbriimonadaceae bacterium]|nr:primosomal protein N' [Fimbriimonadaceae bacterium]